MKTILFKIRESENKTRIYAYVAKESDIKRIIDTMTKIYNRKTMFGDITSWTYIIADSFSITNM